jgi:hypothetical protein
MAKQLIYTGGHFDSENGYGSDSELDQGPVVQGTPDHHEAAIPGRRRHIGGIGEGTAETKVFGEYNAEHMSQVADDYLSCSTIPGASPRLAVTPRSSTTACMRSDALMR